MRLNAICMSQQISIALVAKINEGMFWQKTGNREDTCSANWPLLTQLN